VRPICAIAFGVAIAFALGIAPAAGAHSGGKAEPRIAAGLTGRGLTRDLVVRLRDVHDGDPIGDATVTASASMIRPHAMQLSPWRVVEKRPGTYRARVQLLMPGTWTIHIAVTGDDVVEASATLRAKVGFSSPGSSATTPVATLPTQIEDTLTGSDFTTMAVLWIHGLAAMGWIIGVVIMAIALASDPALLTDGVHARLSRWYRRFGVWLHWGLVPVIVATGVYNLVYVTPFRLAWTPTEVRRLVDIPYGELYEAILIVKLALFAALLITATQVLRRTIRSAPAPDGTRTPSALTTLRTSLGVPGIVYVASVPLILAAAMALRYVHILSHVATVLNESS
jgi:uncharacterized membrane protein